VRVYEEAVVRGSQEDGMLTRSQRAAGEEDDRTDRALIARTAEGDESAFRLLYERLADRVFRYAFILLHNRHLAEEVAQETMVVVWRQAAKFEGRSKVSTWVFGIARFRALDLLRKEQRGARVPETVLVEPDPAPAVHDRERALGAIKTLPEEQREVVFLTFYEGLSYGEIAGMLGIPEGTVKSRMHYARRALAEALT
jgi:RNA polymerase sigma-70 factor (ECF subfamily)